MRKHCVQSSRRPWAIMPTGRLSSQRLTGTTVLTGATQFTSIQRPLWSLCPHSPIRRFVRTKLHFILPILFKVSSFECLPDIHPSRSLVNPACFGNLNGSGVVWWWSSLEQDFEPLPSLPSVYDSTHKPDRKQSLYSCFIKGYYAIRVTSIIWKHRSF